MTHAVEELLRLTSKAASPPCDHVWEDTGGAASGDAIEQFQRCGRCKAAQTIETPRVTLADALDHANADNGK